MRPRCDFARPAQIDDCTHTVVGERLHAFVGELHQIVGAQQGMLARLRAVARRMAAELAHVQQAWNSQRAHGPLVAPLDEIVELALARRIERITAQQRARALHVLPRQLHRRHQHCMRATLRCPDLVDDRQHVVERSAAPLHQRHERLILRSTVAERHDPFARGRQIVLRPDAGDLADGARPGIVIRDFLGPARRHRRRVLRERLQHAAQLPVTLLIVGHVADQLHRELGVTCSDDARELRRQVGRFVAVPAHPLTAFLDVELGIGGTLRP